MTASWAAGAIEHLITDHWRAFLADPVPDACEKVVGRLLDLPRHGERWARHWMGIWRYADWYGRRHVPDMRNSAPQIWRWRDFSFSPVTFWP